MKKSIKFLPLLATGLLAVGCQDYDAGFTEADIKTKQYADKFVQEFGQVDPNQDWSMATLVEANINIPEIQGSAKMNIMTGDPRLSSTRLLAQAYLEDGKAQLKFNAIKGRNNLFVTVEQDGKYKVFGEYNIINGKLGVGDVADFLAAPAGLTRATSEAFSSTCPTKQSTTGNYLVDADWATYQVVTGTAIKYNQQEKSYDQWVIDTKAFVTEQNSTQYYPFTDESVRHFVISSVDFENSTWVEKDDVTKNTDELIKWNANGASVSKTADDWKTYVENQTDAYSYWNNNGNYPYTRESIVKFKNPAEQWHDAYYDWSSPVLKDGCTTVPVGSLMTYNSTTKTLQEWKDEALANSAAIMAGTYDGPFELSSFVINTEDCPAGTTGAIYLGTYPVENWVRKDDAVDVSTYGTEHVKVQYLSGVETVPAPTWDAMLGNSFFGTDAFFEEGIAYYSDASRINDPNAPNNLKKQKLDKYYTTTQMVEMEKGFKIHTNAQTGAIELPYIFGCTAYSNQFGYVYWSDAEAADPDFNPLALKHFVLIEDARPSSNIADESGAAITGSTFASGCWPSLVSMNHSYTGTSYRVMFFGADRNATTGDYQFPENYNIVFFISSLAGEDKPSALFTDHNPHGNGTSFNYSDPELNKKLIGHETTKRTGEQNGMVKCISWTHDGNTYMGFGDNSGDEDLNDIVFLVSGNFDHNNLIEVAPIKWHKNYDGKHHDGVEVPGKDDDLFDIYSLNIGATYTTPTGEPTRDGFVFLGWAESPDGPVIENFGNKTVANKNGACYFAKWAPEGGDNVTITWHNNYDGKHHDGTNNTTADDDIHAQNTIAKSSTYSKPSTTPEAPEGKTFKGWAPTPTINDDSEILSEDQLTNQTATEDKCYFAIWEETPPVTPDPEWVRWLFACEDLGGTFDYDFNDVVLEFVYGWKQVSNTNVEEGPYGGQGNGATWLQAFAEIYLHAAGGTLPAEVYYGDELLKVNDKSEIHQIFGQDPANVYDIVNATNPMTVTTPICIKKFSDADAQAFMDTPANVLPTVTENLKIKVTTPGTGDSHFVTGPTVDAPYKGTNKAPEIIVLPYDWEWPTENTCIKEAYDFTNWVTNASSTDWLNTKKSGKTVTRSH